MRRKDWNSAWNDILFFSHFNPQIQSSRESKKQVQDPATSQWESIQSIMLTKICHKTSYPQEAMITCACGRVADHKYKEGIIFSNSLILGKLATFLHKNDIFSLKLAFSNYHLIEVYLHELSCKEHKWGIRCDCSHRSLIVTIWPQKYPKKYKKIQNIQKNTKKSKNPS